MNKSSSMPSFTSTKTTVLPTIRRNTSTGAKLRGLAISTTNVKRRPKVGKIAKGIPMLPEVEPPRRVPRLKVKKGEVSLLSSGVLTVLFCRFRRTRKNKERN